MAITPKVLLKRSSVVDRAPSSGDLEYGELAINFADGKLYYKNSSNDIKAFVDSARVKSIADAVVASGVGLFDSANAIQLIDSAYVQLRQTPQDFQYTSLTGSPNIQAMIDSEIAALIDGAPGALDTLNELAAAIGDDPNFITTLTNLANAQLDSAEVIALIDSAYIQQRQTPQDFAYSSLTGSPTTVSTFTNDANYLDSNTVTGVIDATYIQANQTTYDFLDSAEAINLIDSSYVQARQDYAYASLTGVPTNVSQFANDAGYLTAATTVDSAEVQGIIDSDFAQRTTDELAEGSSNLYYTTTRADSDFDIRLTTKTTTDLSEGDNLYYTTVRADSDFDIRLATKSTDDLSEGVNQYYTTIRHNADTLVQVDSAYVQLRQDYAYASLTGAPTNVSQFTNDAGYITTAQSTDSAEVSAIILEDVDSAYVQARQDYSYSSLTGAPTNVSDFTNDAGYLTDANTLDSAEVIQLIDSAYVQLRQTPQDFAYSSLTGAPTNVSDFTNDANYLDSNTVTGVIDASYIQANQTTYDFLDSAEAVNLIDSAHIQARQDYAYSSLTGAPTTVSTFTNDANYIATNDSALLSALTTSGDVVVGGNLQVNGTTLTVNSETLAVGDNLIYMNQLESSGSPTLQVDVGWAANVNDNGSYTHVGMFRDATDDTFKVFGNYIPDVDSAVQIDTNHASFELAPFAAKTLSGEYLGFDSDLATKTTTDVTEGTNLYYTDTRADSRIALQVGANLDLSSKSTSDLSEGTNLYYTKSRVDSDIAFAFNDSNNTVNVTINNYIEDKVDSAYVLARVAAAPFLDSADAIGLIDSAYVQQRQDFAYASLTGAPTNVSDFTNDAGYLTDASTLDSAEVIALIDSAYVQQRQDFAYASLTGTPTNVSQFANDAGYLTDANTLDSAEVIALIDSAYVQLRQTPQDFAYASLTGSPTNVSQFTNDAGYLTTATAGGLDSANVSAIITNDVDTAFINALTIDADTLGGQTGSYYLDYTNFTNTPNVLDSNDVISIHNSLGGVDSAAVLALVTSEGFTKYDSDNTTGMLSIYATQSYVTTEINNLIDGAPGTLDTLNEIAAALNDDDSAYNTLLNLINLKTDFDSANVISLVDSAYIELRRPAETIFTVVNNGTSAYTFTGDGFSSGRDNPTLYLTRGKTYKFGMSASGHPFQIRVSDGGSAYNTGVTNNGAQTGDIFFTPDMNAPTSLVYQCTVHSGMVGDIVILDNTDIFRDSAFVTGIIDSAYIQLRQTAAAGGTDSATVISLITSTVDSAYVALREADAGGGSGGTDSATVSAIIINDVDSAYVQARQLNETAAELTQVNTVFTATAAQTSFTGLDIDSDKFQVYLNGLLLPRADFTHNSAQVDLLVAADSDDILEVIKFTGNDTGAHKFQQRHYIYTATSGQTVFTGSDDNSATLSYTQGRINVYLNGLLLIDSADYAQSVAGDTVTFTTGVTAGHVVDIQTLSGNTGAFAPLEQKLYEFIADSAQTVFTGSDNNGATLAYSTDKVTVYINGILQTTSDYTATNGTSITLNAGTNLLDVVTIANIEGNNIGLDSGQVNDLISGSSLILDSAAVTTLINDYIVDTDVALTTIATDQIVDTFSASTYRTAKYIIQMSHSSGYHSNEILLVHDGSSVYMTTYAEVITASSLGTIDADINSGNVRLLFTPTNTNTDINITRINVDV